MAGFQDFREIFYGWPMILRVGGIGEEKGGEEKRINHNHTV